MQRKELKKAIKKFSSETNFYKLGLIKKYIKQRIKEKQKLLDSIPKVKCPYCKSHNIHLEYSEDDYDSIHWLYCSSCEQTFKDNYGYKEAKEELLLFPWSDTISVELYFESPNINTENWKVFCEKEIKIYLGIIQEEPINSIF